MNDVNDAAFDPILLEVLWSRMISIADEVGTSIARTGFSTVLRENHDYSCGVFDHTGTMMAQSSQSATGHIGAMPYLARELLAHRVTEAMEPGDVFVTNDPWIGCGHNNDMYIGAPAFRGDTLVGLVITSAHQMDIGGRLASPHSRQVYEEGILLPPLKLYRAGVPNDDILDIMRLNVRFADKVLGDIRAQVAATSVGCARLVRVMSEYGLDSFVPLANAIVERTERQMRAAIGRLRPGTYHGSAELEEKGDDGSPLVAKVAVEVKSDRVLVDFTGTSPQVEKPINCVLNYTRAYTVLGFKLALAPFLPNNDGSYRPIEIVAPKGSLLNAEFPAACHWRHFVGLRLPDLLFRALGDAIPEAVLAGSGACPVWLFTMAGYRRDMTPFLLNAHAMGGLGARPDTDGISTVTFPPNVRDIPAEVIETETPLIVECREYLPNSGGAGRTRGGLGERLTIRARAEGDLHPRKDVVISVFPGRLRKPAQGLFGGHDGGLGTVMVNGVASTHDRLGNESVLAPGDELTYRTPGGGGYGHPFDRNVDDVVTDARRGYVGVDEARETYGVALDPETFVVDEAATAALRSDRGDDVAMVGTP